MQKRYYTLIFLFFLSPLLPAQSILYVNPSATGSGTGASWVNAFTDLQSALIAWVPQTAIWVAGGVYHTDTAGIDRFKTFEIASGMRLYGGFQGIESSLAERNWMAYPTILDGDIGVLGDSTDNTYVLCTMNSPNDSTLLDGFYFEHAVNNQAGSNSGSAIVMRGIDAPAYPDIQNCVFRNNTSAGFGGAVFVDGGMFGIASPRFINCLFEKNRSLSAGGAIMQTHNGAINRSPNFKDCSFIANRAVNGGALHWTDYSGIDTLEVDHCHFADNRANNLGGALTMSTGSDSGICFTITRTDFDRNGARIGGVMSLYADNGFIRNLVIDSCRFYKNFERYQSTGGYAPTLLLYAGGYIPNPSWTGQITISNSNFLENGSGAGFGDEIPILLPCNITFYHNEFFRNNYGFLIYGKIEFIKNRIYECKTDIFINSNYQKNGLVAHNLIYNNQIDAFAYISYSKVTYAGNVFVNNTLNMNNSNQGNSNMYYYNNIFLNNINSTPTGNVIYNIPAYNDTNYFYNNLLDFPPNAQLPSNFHVMSGNLFQQDPMFVDSTSGNFSLMSCSPAIESGFDSVWIARNINLDLAGHDRISDGHSDIGAYESVPLSAAAPPLAAPSCMDQSTGKVQFQIANGCSPYVFHWEGPNCNGSDTAQLAPGQYFFTATDQNGKVWTDSVAIMGEGPDAYITGDTFLCPGTLGFANVQVTGGTPGFDYLWNTGLTAPTIEINGGYHAVTVTDVHGCRDTAAFTAYDYPIPEQVIQVTPASCATCSDGAIAVTVTSPGNYSIFWLLNGDTSFVISGLLPGNYDYVLTDAHGCTYSHTVFCDTLVGVSTPESQISLRVFPNPVSARLYLSLDEGLEDLGVLSIYSAEGSLQYQSGAKAAGGLLAVETANLAPGSYLIEWRGADGRRGAARFAVQR